MLTYSLVLNLESYCASKCSTKEDVLPKEPHKTAPLGRSILQQKLSRYHYSIIFNWTSWLLNKSNKNFWNEIHYWEVSVKYLDQIAIAPLRGEILWVVANVQVYLKVIKNRLVQVHDISWKFRVRNFICFDLDRCSKKGCRVWVWKHLWWSFFLVNERVYFFLNVLWNLLPPAPLNGRKVLKKKSLVF